MESEARSGLTSTTILGIIFSMFFFTPVNLYLYLVVGPYVAAPTSWFTIVLFVELLRFAGKKITPQEAAIIYLLPVTSIAPITLVFRAWYANSDVAMLFGLIGKFPSWWVPLDPEILRIRNIFLPVWTVPISLLILSTLTAILLQIGLAFFARNLFTKVEKLQFPIQQAVAYGIETLSIGKTEKRRLLFIFALMGFIWGFFVYALPFVIQAWTGRVVTLIPAPWIDLNLIIQPVLRGACFGVATDIAFIFSGFILPFKVVISMVIGSLSVWVFGNWFIVNNNIGPSWWLPRMDLATALQRSTLHFWAAPLIGFSLVAGILPLLTHPRTVYQAFSSLRRVSSETLSITWIILLWASTTVCGILFYAILTPGFPLWIAALMVTTFPLLAVLIGGRTLGETGVTVTPFAGSITNIAFLSSGYEGVEVWLVPQIQTVDPTGWLTYMTVADQTKTTILSLFKAYFIMLPVSITISFTFLNFFWNIAPIPSERYPATQIFWPIDAVYQSLWIKGKQIGIFNPMWIVYAFAIGVGIYFLTQAPIISNVISYVSLTAGFAYYPPFAVTLLIGFIIGLFLKKIFGVKYWNENRMIIGIGLMLGEALAVSLGISVALITNSLWVMPY